MTARRIFFAIDQRQDFWFSLAYATMLEERRPEREFETVALLLAGELPDEFAAYVHLFDRWELLPGYHPPNTLRSLPGTIGRALAYRRRVRELGLRSSDVVAGYSFRAIVLNAIVRSASEKPTFVKIRKCDSDQEKLMTRRRPVVSAYFNLWNVAFGSSRLRYRWLPSSNRHGTGTYRRDPYDVDFCISADRASLDGAKRVPWPLAVLRERFRVVRQEDDRPTVVVLGERYPLVEDDDLDAFRQLFDAALAFVRDTHRGHRLVFKPRSERSFVGQNLEGYELGRADVVLESLLLVDPTVEKVISFKSSGSVIAGHYGVRGYLLYPLCALPADFRAHLDHFFADARASVVLVERLDDLLVAGAAAESSAGAASRVVAESRPLIDALLWAGR